MRIVLAEDSALIRAGIREILSIAGHDVVAEAADADELREKTCLLVSSEAPPDLIITDVRMPPGHTDDGLRAAVELRQQSPQLAVMVLSAYVSGPYVRTLLADTDGGGLGYLLKDRVSKVSDFLASLDIVAAGGMVIDPEVVSHSMTYQPGGPLARLTQREKEVLELMAQGLSNTEIETRLYLSKAAVAKHVSAIFLKLDLPPGEENRRVRAVLAWIDGQRRG